ncbi:MAG TPA: MFS transporter [Solirubrobacteraceae bacterium]
MRPLRLPTFRRLFAAYTVNEIGDSVALVALALLVFDQTGSALSTTGLFIATRFLPALVSPLLIARVDQYPARRVLALLYFGEGLVFVALAALSDSFVLVAVLALGLLDGTLALAGRGMVRSAVAGSLEPHGLLREGNGLMNVGFAVAAVGGAALGGFLVAEAGFAAALLADAASFFVIALMLATAKLPSATPEREPFWQRLTGGLSFVRSVPQVQVLLVGQALALVLFTLIVPIEVVYARETLGTDEAGFGILLSAWGAGIVVGSLVFIAAKRLSPLLLVAGSTAAVAVAYIGMSLVDSLAAASGLSVLGGTGNGIQWVAVMTALQMTTPLDLQARVVGLLESIAAAVPGLGFLAGGALTALTSPSAAYGVAGWGLLAVLAVAFLLRRRIPTGALAGPTGDPGPPHPVSHDAPAEQVGAPGAEPG